MKYKLTAHARERLRERNITYRVLEEALRNPTKVAYDAEGKLFIKTIYKQRNRERLLLIVGRFAGEVLLVITVIDTSKVKKCL